MDLKNSLDFRTYRSARFNDTGRHPYDYTRNGVLTKALPKVLFRGNPILVSFLQMLDMRIIMMMKSIDRLKHFKDITWW